MEKMKKVISQEETMGFSRRDFIGTAAVAGAFLAACGTQKSAETAPKLVTGPQVAPDGPVLKAGLIGCGGRGTGAAGNFLDAGPNLEVVALADVFEDRLEKCRGTLKEQRGVEIADSMCFTGFDGYKKLLETDVDIAIQATPPHFRPQHFAAAVQARKHVFMEKPLGVDPVGVRSILESAEKADAFGLCVVTGTQMRHWKSIIETYNRLQDGVIGEIVAARGYSLRGQLWFRPPQEDLSDMENMLRDWVNWQWLSGDHLVEQHIHGIDALCWFAGQYPVKVVALGGRARRPTGDQYDFFSMDYELENGVHVHSMCRQVDGCANNISRYVIGTNGWTNCMDTIWGPNGEVIWQYPEELKEKENPAQVQEHIDLVTSIRTGNPINEAPRTAKSTLVAIMGRESAYTGLEVTWDELMNSDQRLGPTEYTMGPVNIKAEPPVPGMQEEA
jgi:predicted dehydrogenase